MAAPAAAPGARVIPAQAEAPLSPVILRRLRARLRPYRHAQAPSPAHPECSAAQQQVHSVPGFVHADAVRALSKPRRPLCRQPVTGFCELDRSIGF